MLRIILLLIGLVGIWLARTAIVPVEVCHRREIDKMEGSSQVGASDRIHS
jgi:hypothetical protein